MKYIKRCILAVLILLILLLTTVFVLATFYKKEIAGILTDNLKTNYALTLKVGTVDVSLIDNFPKASIKLKDVVIDHDLHPGESALLKAGTLSISFDLKKLLKKEFEITAIALKDAQINMIRNKDGSKNFQFQKQDTSKQLSKTQSINFDAHKITIVNTQFNFTNHLKEQHITIDFIDNTINLKKNNEGFDIDLKGNAKIGGLVFNPKKGGFLMNTPVKLNLSGILFTGNKSVFVHTPSFVEIDDIHYNVNAFIQLGKEKKLALKIESENASYQKTSKLLNKNISNTLSNFTISKPLNVSFLITTSLDVKQEPLILLKVKSSNNTITIGNSKILYTNVSFAATILSVDSTHTKGDETRAIVMLKDIKGVVYNVPFTAAVSVNNFSDPFIDISASLLIDAAKVKLKASNEFELKGICLAKVHYAGSTKKLNEKEFLSKDMKLKANLAFKKFSYKEHHKPYVYTINGNASVTNTDLKFNNLQLQTAGGNVLLNGKVDLFAQYVLGYSTNLKINLNASSNLFDINPFLGKKSNSDKALQSSQKNTKQLNEDNTFDFNVSLKAKKMLIRKVIANDVALNLTYKNGLLNVKSLNMNTCDGKLNANATISNLETIKAEINAENINVSKLFDEFENFGQQAIQSNQLKGKISVNATFSTTLDDKMEIIPATMLGNVKLKLKEGHLLNYEPLQNISTFIFHNRDFNDVTFSEINESFKLTGYEMKIEELEIASNILNLFVSGTYNFKTQSNINLVIPWNNLKRRGKNYIPKISGQSAEDAKGLKLNFAGASNKMKLSLGHK